MTAKMSQKYEYCSDIPADTNYTEIHGPDGMVSYQTVLDLLNGIDELAHRVSEVRPRGTSRITSVYRMEHIECWVVASGDRDAVGHDLIKTMLEATDD